MLLNNIIINILKNNKFFNFISFIKYLYNYKNKNNSKFFSFIIFIKFLYNYKNKYINKNNKDYNLKNKIKTIFFKNFIKYLI